MIDQRLEELSDQVRKGYPVGFLEALEVIDYQEKIKKLKKSKPSLLDKFLNLFTRKKHDPNKNHNWPREK